MFSVTTVIISVPGSARSGARAGRRRAAGADGGGREAVRAAAGSRQGLHDEGALARTQGPRGVEQGAWFGIFRVQLKLVFLFAIE